MGQRNLRQHPRQRVRMDASVEGDWGVLDGKVENIGEGGAFFLTDTLEGSVREGDRATLRFRPPAAAEESVIAGEVLRVERYFHEGVVYRTFAIRFDHEEGGARGGT